MTRAAAWARAGATALGFAALDQLTKAIVVASMERGESSAVFPGIELTHVRNTGVAFGAFAGGGTVVAVLTAVSLVLLLGYFAVHARTAWLWLPVGVVVGGAAGNLIDRAARGAVVDFIDPIAWPAFNLADAGIVVGVLGLLYVVEGRSRESRVR